MEKYIEVLTDYLSELQFKEFTYHIDYPRNGCFRLHLEKRLLCYDFIFETSMLDNLRYPEGMLLTTVDMMVKVLKKRNYNMTTFNIRKYLRIKNNESIIDQQIDNIETKIEVLRNQIKQLKQQQDKKAALKSEVVFSTAMLSMKMKDKELEYVSNKVKYEKSVDLIPKHIQKFYVCQGVSETDNQEVYVFTTVGDSEYDQVMKAVSEKSLSAVSWDNDLGETVWEIEVGSFKEF